jgi:hypothetical protein
MLLLPGKQGALGGGAAGIRGAKVGPADPQYGASCAEPACPPGRGRRAVITAAA